VTFTIGQLQLARRLKITPRVSNGGPLVTAEDQRTALADCVKKLAPTMADTAPTGLPSGEDRCLVTDALLSLQSWLFFVSFLWHFR
jgi:hypothetical protein